MSIPLINTNIRDLTTTQLRKLHVFTKFELGLPKGTHSEKLYAELLKYTGTRNQVINRSYMLQNYNRDVEKQNRNIIIQNALRVVALRKAQAEINFTQLNKTMPFEGLGDYIHKWIKLFNKDGKHFSFELKSTKANVSRLFRFHSISHFDSWFNNSIEKEMSSAGNQISKKEMKDLFDVITITNLRIIGGGCNKNGECNKKNLHKSAFYDFKLMNPSSMNNNCLFACIRKLLGDDVLPDTRTVRKEFNLPTNTPVSIVDAYKIIDKYKLDISIIDFNTPDELDEKQLYIVYKEGHFYVLTSFEKIKPKSTNRGNIYFDFETRMTEQYVMVGDTKSYFIEPSTCCAVITDYKAKSSYEKVFITDNEKGCARKFMDFLNEQNKINKSYHIMAHNGGKFDFYFILGCLRGLELPLPQMRGNTIIGITYLNNYFKDSYCFLTSSLDELSSSFKVDKSKITSIELRGKTMTSNELCFYRPELTFNEFMNLQHTDPEYWELYIKYCMYDCYALKEVWEKFADCINTMIQRIDPENKKMMVQCKLIQFMTIGSHSKQILNQTNKDGNGVLKYARQGIKTFMGITIKYDNGKAISESIDMEKYEFLCKFKRGGISHCNMMGTHINGIFSVDITSQYPSALIYGYCPTGKSFWITKYDPTKYGFYHIKNLVFDPTYLFKPIAQTNPEMSLNWSCNKIDELYIDSYMLDYLNKNCGLISYEFVKGLVSSYQVKMDKLFGSYINTFYAEKQRQDVLKEQKDDAYNPALRESIKLYLNSLTGKLVENPETYFQLERNEESIKLLNGVGVEKMFNEGKYNDWLITGIMVYSYSKRILFEYINCLPRKANNVIHVETDGIYAPLCDIDEFTNNLNNYKGEYPCKFGNDLGNIKIEHKSNIDDKAHFIGKKFYDFCEGDKWISRVKGIVKKTINADGSTKIIVDKEFYEKVARGETIISEFATLNKKLMGKDIKISAHNMTRTTRPSGKYHTYCDGFIV